MRRTQKITQHIRNREDLCGCEINFIQREYNHKGKKITQGMIDYLSRRLQLKKLKVKNVIKNIKNQ